MRENLTLAAWVKLHAGTREKFERVEQVMDVVREMEVFEAQNFTRITFNFIEDWFDGSC